MKNKNIIKIIFFYFLMLGVAIAGDIEFESDNIKAKWLKIMKNLQEENRINHELTIPWIFDLFGSIIETSIYAVEAGDVARNDSKKIAWISFKGAIGLKE